MDCTAARGEDFVDRDDDVIPGQNLTAVSHSPPSSQYSTTRYKIHI